MIINSSGDTRYVYGARCTWHGPISAIGRKPVTSLGIDAQYHTDMLPCCPHCGGVLFEYPNKATWDNLVALFNEKRPGYTEFVEWLGSYGRCWPNYVDAEVLYKVATGKEFTLATKS